MSTPETVKQSHGLRITPTIDAVVHVCTQQAWLIGFDCVLE